MLSEVAPQKSEGIFMNINELQERIAKFSKDRDWDRFHTPKNLVMAISGEVGELTEIFQWLDEEQSKNINSVVKKEVEHEIADVFIYLLRLCDVLNIDPQTSINEKLVINSEKYPINLSKGNAIKYNRRED